MSSSEDERPLKRSESRRKRNMLKAYYSLPSEGGGQGEGLDGPGIDVEAYVKKVLAKGGVKKLLGKDTALWEEIKGLDGELQMLVYGNYTNFIAATELVSGMKQNIGEMGGVIGELGVRLGEVSAGYSELQQKLERNKGEVEKLAKANATLQKVKFIADLPGRLQYYAGRGEYQETLRYWHAGEKILQKYCEIKSFAKVRVQCEEVIQNLQGKLTGERTVDVAAGSVDFSAISRVLTVLRGSETVAEYLEKTSRSLDDVDSFQTEKLHKKIVGIVESGTTIFPGFIEDDLAALCREAGERREKWINVLQELDIVGYPVQEPCEVITEINQKMVAISEEALLRVAVNRATSHVEGATHIEKDLMNLNIIFHSSSDARIIDGLMEEAGKTTCPETLLQFVSLLRSMAKSRQTTMAESSLIPLVHSYVLRKGIGTARGAVVVGCVDEVRSPSGIARSTVAQIMKAGKDIATMLPKQVTKQHPRDGRSRGSGTSRDSRSTAAALFTGVDFVFSSGPLYPTKPTSLEAEHIASCLVTYVLRTLLETTRAQVFTATPTLHQHQLDIAYYKATLTPQPADIARLLTDIEATLESRTPPTHLPLSEDEIRQMLSG